MKKSYEEYFEEIKLSQDLETITKLNGQNSLAIRVSLYYLINNTLSDIDRAKLLNLLWIKAKEIKIEKAIYMITIILYLQLYPKPSY